MVAILSRPQCLKYPNFLQMDPSTRSSGIRSHDDRSKDIILSLLLVIINIYTVILLSENIVSLKMTMRRLKAHKVKSDMAASDETKII